MNTFKGAYIEISGVCNARCPWCITGRTPISERSNTFMSAELFESVVKKLCSEVHLETSRLNLYNWGEPTLNPDFLEILEIAIRYGFKIGISSNASFWVDIPQQILDYIESWVFSVSGFSQASYDRIHGFNVNTIYENIARYSNIFFSKPSRFRKNLTMAFHVYNFNKGEINDAKKFCMKHAINFYPYFAFLNDFDRAIGYLKTRQDKTRQDNFTTKSNR